MGKSIQVQNRLFNTNGSMLIQLMVMGGIMSVLGLAAAEMSKNMAKASRGPEQAQNILGIKNDIHLFLTFLENAPANNGKCREAFSRNGQPARVNFNLSTPQNVQFTLPEQTPIWPGNQFHGLYIQSSTLTKVADSRTPLGGGKFLNLVNYQVKGMKHAPGSAPTSLGSQNFETTIPMLIVTTQSGTSEVIDDCRVADSNQGPNLQTFCPALGLVYNAGAQKCDPPPFTKTTVRGAWVQHFMSVFLMREPGTHKLMLGMYDYEWGSWINTIRQKVVLEECAPGVECRVNISAIGPDGQVNVNACLPATNQGYTHDSLPDKDVIHGVIGFTQHFGWPVIYDRENRFILELDRGNNNGAYSITVVSKPATLGSGQCEDFDTGRPIHVTPGGW